MQTMGICPWFAPAAAAAATQGNTFLTLNLTLKIFGSIFNIPKKTQKSTTCKPWAYAHGLAGGGGGESYSKHVFGSSSGSSDSRKRVLHQRFFFENFRRKITGTLHCCSGSLAGKTVQCSHFGPFCFRSAGAAPKAKKKFAIVSLKGVGFGG